MPPWTRPRTYWVRHLGGCWAPVWFLTNSPNDSEACSNLSTTGINHLGAKDASPSAFVDDVLLFSCSIVFHSLQPEELWHTRLPCPSLTPGVCSNSMSTELVMPSNHLIFYFPLLLLPSNFPASGSFPTSRLFTSGGWRYWSFSFSINPSNEYSGLTFFRIAWFDLIAVQGSLLQHHSSKASILWCSAFFMVHFSCQYMTTEKNHSFDYIDLHWQSEVSAFQ